MNKYNKNFTIFTLGLLISGLGTQIYNFAIGLYVLKITGSSVNFSLTLIFSMLPQIILSPIAGNIADKISRKKMLVTMDYLCGLTLIIIYFFSKTNSLSLILIYFTSFLLSSFNAFFMVNIESCIPNLVPKDKILKLNSIYSMIISLVRIAGPLLGGVCFGFFSIYSIIIFNAISFIFSATLELFFDIEKKERIKDKQTSFFYNLKEGLSYFVNNKILFYITIYAMLVNFFSVNLSIALPYYCLEILKIDSSLFGFVQMGLPLGMVISSFLIALSKKDNKAILKTTILMIIVIGFLHIILSINMISNLNINLKVLIIFIILLMIGFSLGFVDIPINTIIQNIIHDNYRGRILGIITSFSRIITPISIFIFGLLVDNFEVYYTIIISAIAFFILAALIKSNKKLRTT
ncbi:MAG: MFS transporter [Pleomorphochaeta sp.]